MPTGLRRNELASITVGQCHLEVPMPYIELKAGDEKNRQGCQIPLRDDVVADLKEWIASKREDDHGPTVIAMTASRQPTTIADERLFIVPEGLNRILKRDLKTAGISQIDERGRRLDVHALRHTFGTLLSKGGVAPRTAQAAMRHSEIGLTMNVYTDPKLLDVAGALDSLPSLPLDGMSSEGQTARATGTDGVQLSAFVAPTVAPNLVQRSISGSLAVNRPANGNETDADERRDATSITVKRKDPQSIQDHGSKRVGVIGIEPTTSTSRT